MKFPVFILENQEQSWQTIVKFDGGVAHVSRNNHLPGFILVIICLAAAALPTHAQETEQLKRQALALTEQLKYTEALPLLETLVAKLPGDAEVRMHLGFALIGQAMNTADDNERRALRVRAREAFVKSHDLGNDQPIVHALIQSLPSDGADAPLFSRNLRAHTLMVEAEAFFSQGKLDEALSDYQRALELDPKLYEAALFAGDVFMHRGSFDQAETWYQKAIKINPNKETAYRYSATPLMKQNKTDEARDRYIEAFISEPYNSFAVAGLTQWARITQTPLGHPQIEIPTDVKFDEKGDVSINLDANAMLNSKNDGSFAWLSYGVTRTAWRKQKFAETFPAEKVYRHSLAEEVDALHSVLKTATSSKEVKSLSPSLAKLKNLDDQGLLEPYILLGRPDAGIAADYLSYLKTSRENLRRYVREYVIGAKN